MARGVLYVMGTVVKGIVKIGRTQTSQFKERRRKLEADGYYNVAGLRCLFAIEVDDYEAKVRMLDDIFAKSRVGTSELFAIDSGLVVQLLSSFEGRQIFPEGHEETKGRAFTQATREHDEATQAERERRDADAVPDGEYVLTRAAGGQRLDVRMTVSDGTFTVPAGQRLSVTEGRSGLSESLHDLRRDLLGADGMLAKDAIFDSPSRAASFVTGRSSNGWLMWKDMQGEPLDAYRTQENA